MMTDINRYHIIYEITQESCFRYPNTNLDPFCFRQFDPKNSSFISYDKQKFEERINELYSPEKLVDGYAPFCKHIIVENFTEAVLSVAPITKEN